MYTPPSSDTSPLESQLTELEARLKSLDDEERRYVKMYGQALMSERLYKDSIVELDEKRSKILTEAAGIRDTLANKQPLPLEKMVDGVIELVGNLDFTDKKAVIRKLVTKIVATKKEITIWGQIPILATGDVGYEFKHRHSEVLTQLRRQWKQQCRSAKARLRAYRKVRPSWIHPGC